MLSNSSNPDHDQLQPQKGLQIKQDDKFFSRLMSKEISMANSSCRVYYGGASGAVPFLWESQPGTPKHPSSESTIPPLTPPPSYQSSFKSKSKQKKSMKSTFLSSIFPRLMISPRKNHASPSSSRSSTSSSSSLSSWSSLYASASSQSANSYNNRKLFHRRRSFFSCSRSPLHNFMDDDDEEEEEGLRSPTSTLCFGLKRRNLKKFIRG
ncbi:hypothetical protein PTKIN_Ptkin01aG0258900 [Pterospermum kingtungense]